VEPAARARRPAWSSTSHDSARKVRHGCRPSVGSMRSGRPHVVAAVRGAAWQRGTGERRGRRVDATGAFWGALIAALGVRELRPDVQSLGFMFGSSRGVIVSGCVDSPGFARAASRCPPTTPWAPCHRHLGRDGGGRFRLARSETLLSVSWMRAAEHVRESRQPLRVRPLRLRSRLGRLLAASCRAVQDAAVGADDVQARRRVAAASKGGSRRALSTKNARRGSADLSVSRSRPPAPITSCVVLSTGLQRRRS
jgi:hypothetical protein